MSDLCIKHHEHDHSHGPDCGHTAILHDGHIDYLHDGHLHHPHGDHVDEHRQRDLAAVLLDDVVAHGRLLLPDAENAVFVDPERKELRERA